MSPALVANCRADLFGHGAQVLYQVLDPLLAEFREFGYGFVQVRDVSRVVLVVVDLHRGGVNVRLQGVMRIGKRRKGERTGRAGRRRYGRGLSAGGAQSCCGGANSRRQGGCLQSLPSCHHI